MKRILAALALAICLCPALRAQTADRDTLVPPDYVDYEARARELPTDAERRAYLLEQASQQRYYEKYAQVRRVLDRLPLSPDEQAQLEAVEQRLAWSRPGQPAIDFRGQTLSGDTLALSDLRGRVVLIDAWATWCAPCLRMMPYLKQLEKELASPDLTFLSVCLGVSVEMDLWRQLAAKHQLEGNVIFCDGWTRGFARDYHVTGVPRFILIDREGRVVSYAAPAPKYPALREMILQALAARP